MAAVPNALVIFARIHGHRKASLRNTLGYHQVRVLHRIVIFARGQHIHQPITVVGLRIESCAPGADGQLDAVRMAHEVVFAVALYGQSAALAVRTNHCLRGCEVIAR